MAGVKEDSGNIKLPIPKQQDVPLFEISDLASIELLQEENPSYRFYPNDIMSSADVQKIMDHTEHSVYRFLLDYCWLADIRCFLPYNLQYLAKLVSVTPYRFLKMWEHVLGKKFRFAKHNGEFFIYNPRLLKEWHRQQERKKSGKKGGEKRVQNLSKPHPHKAKSQPHVKNHPFDKSPIYEKEKFLAALIADKDFKDIDAGHYYLRVKTWSAKSVKGKHHVSNDWLLVAKTFILNDAKDNKLKLKSEMSEDKKLKYTQRLGKVSLHLQPNQRKNYSE